MGKGCFVNAGTVTILTESLVLFQGIIVHEDGDKRHHDDEPIVIKNEIKVESENEFIALRLTCVPIVISITGAAFHFVSVPFYTVDQIIKINVDEILSIGPNTGCLTAGG